MSSCKMDLDLRLTRQLISHRGAHVPHTVKNTLTDASIFISKAKRQVSDLLGYNKK